MADPGMLSLFGDDAGLFSDGFDGLGDSFPQQAASAQTNATMNHEHQGNRPYHQGMMAPAAGQPKMGQMYDHGSYGGYDQSGAAPGRMMAQNGPSQGPTNVNPAMNGMASHYHNSPANSTNPHHGGYTGDAGAAGGGWAQQQNRLPYPQPPSQGAPNQMGGYQMPQGNYSGMQGPPGANAARMNQHYSSPSMAPASAQDPAHYLGHVGMSGPQMRHPHAPQQQGQAYPNMGHTPRFPLSPTRQPPHTHPHPQQGMGGYTGGQYPGYQGQYGAIGPGMNQGANLNVGPNPQALGQRFPLGSGPAPGQQAQRYPPGAPHQPHTAPMPQAGQQGQPMHPLNHTQNQAQSHLAPPAQGSYQSPSSLSPMRGLGTPTPPPQGRPPSAGLVGSSEVSGYNSMQSPPHAMSHQQRPPQAPLPATHPQHQQPHLPPSAGQMYPGIGPQHAAPMGPNRHPIPPQAVKLQW
ncbi:chromodomain-helicase-DNA-binding protein 7-like [Eucyclogobius newberryi]|uniref:chromodomain-helicase-DNA-binding protein 7-like n=1 Tax=Eucyclogobius newberryi TaxID=166745 RepID=UPI003B58E904